MNNNPAFFTDLRSLARAYVVLVAVTLVSAATAFHVLPVSWVPAPAAGIFILAIVATKSSLIALCFMHLWQAPRWLQLLVLGWVFVVVSAISAILATAPVA